MDSQDLDSVLGKQPDSSSTQKIHEILRFADKVLPRVGRKGITEEQIRARIQEVYFRKTDHVYGRRGTDRTMTPTEKCSNKKPPRSLMLLLLLLFLRSTGEAKVEAVWEQWQQLPSREQI